MAALNREVRAIQNPALGAVLLWRACCGYHSTSQVASSMPLPLLFIALPVLFHEETADLLRTTRLQSGLRKFIEKFHSSPVAKTDLVLAISRRSNAMRGLTLESLRTAVASNLMAVDVSAAGVFPLSKTPPSLGIPASVRPLLSGAEKLGSWLAQVSLYEVSLLFKVDF